MPRPDKQSYDLTDTEKSDLITPIQQGKSLPERYCFILSENERKSELVWNGKTAISAPPVGSSPASIACSRRTGARRLFGDRPRR